MFDVDVRLWPLAVGFAFLTAAALFQWRAQFVPNRLGFLFLVAGLAASIAAGQGLVPSRGGGVTSSLVGMFIGLGALLPIYARGYLGAACVKSQAVFGLWVGCAVPVAICWKIVAAATIVAALVTIGAAVIVHYLRTEDERELHLFPAQITLSLCSIVAASGFFLIAGV